MGRVCARARTYVHPVPAWYLRRPEKTIGHPETGVADVCKAPCGHWGSSSQYF